MNLPQHPSSATYTIPSLEALSQWATQWATYLQPGEMIALHGPMGAGKTTLTQALGTALGVTERINSPTFVLIHEYTTGRWPIVHADLYRLGPEQADGLLDELSPAIESGNTLILVEWARKSPDIMALCQWHVTLTPSNDPEQATVRTLSVKAPSADRLIPLSAFESSFESSMGAAIP